MFDLLKLFEVKQKLQFSLAGITSADSNVDYFESTCTGCDGNCSGTCDDTCEGYCEGCGDCGSN